MLGPYPFPFLETGVAGYESATGCGFQNGNWIFSRPLRAHNESGTPPKGRPARAVALAVVAVVRDRGRDRGRSLGLAVREDDRRDDVLRVLPQVDAQQGPAFAFLERGLAFLAARVGLVLDAEDETLEERVDLLLVHGDEPFCVPCAGGLWWAGSQNAPRCPSVASLAATGNPVAAGLRLAAAAAPRCHPVASLAARGNPLRQRGSPDAAFPPGCGLPHGDDGGRRP